MQDQTTAAATAEAYARNISSEVERAARPGIAAADYVGDALDATYLVTSSGDVRAVNLTVTVGGPRVEVQHYLGTETVTVRAWWPMDYAEHHVHAPALALALTDLGELWQDATVTAAVIR